MKNFLNALLAFIRFGRFSVRQPEPSYEQVWQAKWSMFLERHVGFYQNLTAENRQLFERRILLFLHTTAVEGGVAVEVTDEDRLLVAASAIIPVWAFTNWHYFNLKSVYLLPASFDVNFVCGGPNATITGMVGTGPMAGKLALSKPHLHLGFLNQRDKQNVGIHEFVHLIDLADGSCDGFPERLKDFSYAIPWLDFVGKKINDINKGNSNIRQYGATNSAEFLSVATEYFFERPRMLQRKHPELCKALEAFYQQSVDDLAADPKLNKNTPCPCGSGKKYKRCCLLDG